MNIEMNHFSLTKIANSGQCFRWELTDNASYIIPPVRYLKNGCIRYSKPLEISQKGNSICLSCEIDEWNSIWFDYFDCDTDYDKMSKVIQASGDSHLITAYNAGEGIRILKQDTFEIIISFLISQNNNIGRIKKSIKALCNEAGLPDNHFPYPGEIDTSIFDKAELGLGYRNLYLKEMYEFVEKNPNWLDMLKSLDYTMAYEELLKRKGIGPKVANCICLFGLHHIDSFPIDTHVKQLLNKYYPNGLKLDAYNGFKGLIQQYLFSYEIN